MQNLKKGSSNKPSRLPTTLDIIMIGAASFHRIIRWKGAETFYTSLYKINHLIKDKQQAQIISTRQDNNSLIN